jgi:hypothetical protein
MSAKGRFSTVLGMAILSMLMAQANAQVTERAAREQASGTIRSQMYLKADQFLRVQRDDELEQLLAAAVSRPSWSEFIYRASEEGDEIKEQVVVHHIVMDGDPTFTVAVSPVTGTAYRIQGFSDSLAEFEKLMKEANVRVSSAEQAEAVAGFYRSVNPERRSMTPLLSLLDLKQAAERQCQPVPFDPNEREFEAWWKRAKLVYADVRFSQTAARGGNGYLVQWTVLSSAGPGNCGGAPLRAQLDVGSDGHVGKIAFSPFPTKPGNRNNPKH